MPHQVIVYHLTVTLSSLNSCMDPVVYCFVTNNFKVSLKVLSCYSFSFNIFTFKTVLSASHLSFLHIILCLPINQLLTFLLAKWFTTITVPRPPWNIFSAVQSRSRPALTLSVCSTVPRLLEGQLLPSPITGSWWQGFPVYDRLTTITCHKFFITGGVWLYI